MKNNTRKIPTSSGFEASIHSHFLEHPTWGKNWEYRNLTKEVLSELQEKTKNRKIMCLDPSLHTSNIEVFSDPKKFNRAEILLPNWIDGVIMNLKDKFDLIIPVADCGWIAVYNKEKDISWVFHAWYSWVSWNTDWDLGIIANMIQELEKLDSLKNYNFIMSPMAWGYFELPKAYAKMIFSRVFSHYDLKEEKYFKPHREDKTKIYLDLKQIILDIFRTYWIKWNRIKNKTDKQTNSPDNFYPSFRLYSTLKTIAQKASEKPFELSQDDQDNYFWLTAWDLNLQEQELLEIGDYTRYLKDYRLALSLRN